jgi:hypothetical protein
MAALCATLKVAFARASATRMLFWRAEIGLGQSLVMNPKRRGHHATEWCQSDFGYFRDEGGSMPDRRRFCQPRANLRAITKTARTNPRPKLRERTRDGIVGDIVGENPIREPDSKLRERTRDQNCESQPREQNRANEPETKTARTNPRQHRRRYRPRETDHGATTKTARTNPRRRRRRYLLVDDNLGRGSGRPE